MVEREHYRDTIFALSSGSGVAGVAVIRLSGPSVRDGLKAMTGNVPAPRVAAYRSIWGADRTRLDRGLVLFFPAPHSFTGEDCGELHIHGGRAVVEAVLQSLSELDGYRSAEPGEFTRRAFENGKMDLTAVEGLADLIAAETEMQRRMALQQSSGALSGLYESWRAELVRARALIEADFDFTDEDDVPGSVADSIWQPLAALAVQIEQHLEAARAGEIIRDGYRVVILGAPNAGKSSLLNALARRDIAIVSDEKGTTRDVLEVHLDIGGYPVILFDTAGLRAKAGAVESEGIRRALKTAGNADLILYLEDLNDPGDPVSLPEGKAPVLRIGTKADLDGKRSRGSHDISISVKQEEGLADLIRVLEQRVQSAAGSAVSSLPNRQRHREYLTACLSALRMALENDSEPLELRAELLRQAGDALGRLTGRIGVEDLLDLIFGEFCIGK
ncbi:tRNA uridine-5-carboxymethylaminomethyl(34) synthesis GTPase MnmE [Hoeflea sp.]|uniref:tRNA uridine-5-carboxymethylaminomethyl(34) synthesis GTPase MnmE n=1 Tax=Hoeflea sp. TaxID=1940281 RepID=UPI003B019734